MAENEQIGFFLVQYFRQALQAFGRHFAGYSGVDHAAPDHVFQYRRIALAGIGPRAESQTVSKSQDDCVISQGRHDGR